MIDGQTGANLSSKLLVTCRLISGSLEGTQEQPGFSAAQHVDCQPRRPAANNNAAGGTYFIADLSVLASPSLSPHTSVEK